MAEEGITINVVGTDIALEKLRLRAGSVRRGARIAMRKTTIRTRGRVKLILATGRGGAPRARHGAAGLSGSIVNLVTESGDVITGQVGSTMPYGTGYAAILEKGGPLPQVTIVAKPGRVLAWPVGIGKLGHTLALSGGRTMRQARAAAIRASNRSGGGGYAYARKVTIPARHQRAMPYLRPGFEEERPLIPVTFETEIRAAMAGKAATEGAGGET